jgi:hypothetical protein
LSANGACQRLVVRSTASFSETKASCREASVLFLLLERVLLLALVMLVNERHGIGDQHERREDDNDHIRFSAGSTSTVP